MKRINIITIDNQSGLTRDGKIIAQLLQQAGFKVSVIEVGKPTLGHKLHRAYTYGERFVSNVLRRQPPYDVNLFLESVIPTWFSYAHVNCLIPNQEWFRLEWQAALPNFDYVLCKTRYAQGLFDQLGCRTEFISFTSLDRWQEGPPKTYDRFFHLAGGDAKQKGTKAIIDVWQRHPEWPKLTIRQKPQSFHAIAPNITYLTEFLEENVLRDRQNQDGIHLCLSEAEGFGHSIVEAMSTQALILTTNAPPMNELITEERGLLVDYGKTEPQRLGMNYYVDPKALEHGVEQVLALDESAKRKLGQTARQWFESNDRFFRQTLVEFLRSLPK